MADIVIVPATVIAGPRAVKASGVAGATITAGQTLYIDTADSNKLKLADSDGTSPANVIAGIALHGASAGQPIQYDVEDDDLTIFSASGVVNSGATIYLSDTPGGMTILGPDQAAPELEAGDTIVVLGVANGATGATGVQKMNFRPITGGVR